MSLKDFEVLSRIGEGAYSSVYKVRRLEDGQIYALKRVKMGGLSPKEKENALNEIRILASIHHPNIVGYKEAFIDQASKSLWYPCGQADSIVMEFASNGDLSGKIAKHIQQNTQVPEETIWSIFVDLVRGLKQLHDLRIFHRDIKTANVFLHQGNGAKLGDMNVSKVSQEGLCLTQTGTPYYASPQVWKDQPYDQKSDIWSLGCVLYELICLKVPFKAEDMEGLYKKVTRGIYARLPPEYSQQLSALIRALLQVNPEQRPSCDKILKMPAVQKRLPEQPLEEELRSELLRTIKAETFQTIADSLPRPNYQQPTKKKAKQPLKTIIEAIQDKRPMEEKKPEEQGESIIEIQSLPMLEKDKKIYPMENSDRVMSKDKLNVHLVNRDRKKSEMGYSRSGLDPNPLTNKLDQIKELKLPKVQNRYNRTKEKGVKHNQNSLRCYKIFEC